MATNRPTRPTEAAVRAQVDEFNRRFPVGTPVTLRMDTGDKDTAVRAPAEVRPGPVAVAWFSGVSAYYCIEGRVTARTVTP